MGRRKETTLLKDPFSKMAERAMAHHPLSTSSFPNSLGALEFPSVSHDSRPLRHERPLGTSQAVEVVYDIRAVDSIFIGSDISGYLLYINALWAFLKRRWGSPKQTFSVSFASNSTVATQKDCSPTVGEQWSLES